MTFQHAHRVPGSTSLTMKRSEWDFACDGVVVGHITYQSGRPEDSAYFWEHVDGTNDNESTLDRAMAELYVYHSGYLTGMSQA